ncbi:Magnesium transport protein CorA, transmembrane region [Glarea lozoyensis ATCC 20868]|uniref:Magnesium transport protein CorA, transmembrane region n=1 Tax=Glarea lozoyensis (strain ATCC 20868 / MF5171) TaxID=1116229 RepID=S3D9D8_GLAL2|nr:Magnesium transport protein CorA, transmembrane region [Glarea lozoyensis ATCC 20868]EPE34320.1 Magnesium transport protein CorA, transmembrane region [Glarea lozoyensis ATCC 20868]
MVDPASEPEPDQYISEIKRLLAPHVNSRWSLESNRSHLTKVAYTDTYEEYPIASPKQLIAQAAILTDEETLSICIIENISKEYVEVLGTEWGIDPMFFVEYASNPAKNALWWSNKWDWKPPEVPGEPDSPNSQELSWSAKNPSFFRLPSGYLDGVFEYHNETPNLSPSTLSKLNSSPNLIYRHCFKDKDWPIQSNTRISYCRPNRFMYLFLVDAPIKFPVGILDQESRSFPTLRLLHSNSRGGVELPHIYDSSRREYSLFENLKTFCHHHWHLRVLFDQRIDHFGCDYVVYPNKLVLPATPLIYLWASCLWEENLKFLDKEIKRISFREIRNPRLEINAILHDRREDLAHIIQGLADTNMYIPREVHEFFATHPNWLDFTRTKPENWDRLIAQANKLDAFLIETFQLFMSSVSVQDSHMSIEQSRLGMEQARRGSQLTYLAFIYVPLSFVTGIFGMNVQQINGTGLNVWVCFVTLVPLVCLTGLVFWGVWFYGRWKGKREKTDEEKV